MIPVYNCSQFLPETLKSVLAQGIPAQQMQIEVVDDASTDTDVEALVNEIGKGRIAYFRQPQNVGSLRNFETCINRSHGKLIHLLHGDDKVSAGYYTKMTALFERCPEAGAAFCRYRCIDELSQKVYDKKPVLQQDGIIPNWLQMIGERQHIQYAAISVRREVYEQLGSFVGLTYGEDWEMWVRIARHFPVAYTPELLAEYRYHTNSISGTKFITGEYLQDLHTTMMLIQEHLPVDNRETILKRSKRYYASYGLKIAYRLWRKLRNKKVLTTQISQVLKLHKSPTLYLLALKLLLKVKFSRS